MALLIGMDEAGYGPNLGPLVISATVWEVPDDPRKIDLWEKFAGIIEQTPPAAGEHIQIADSKQVYTPARGFDNLEAGVLVRGGDIPGRLADHFDDLRRQGILVVARDATLTRFVGR